jgi:hypothetical protein
MPVESEDQVQIARADIERMIIELDQEHMKFRKSLQKKKRWTLPEAAENGAIVTLYENDRQRLLSRLKALPEPATP